jgi:pre-rRNA-processing protein TSR1
MEKGNELFVLDCLKVCDSVLFVASAAFPEDDIIDRNGNKMLNMALAQGVALPIVTLMDLESIAPKKRANTKTFIQKVINKILPDEKVMGLETNADGLNVLR